MVDVLALERRARRVASRSRLRMASRIGLAIVPAACLPWLGGVPAETCLCLSLALFAVGVALRFWDLTGAQAVAHGLVLGTVPALAALGLARCGLSCSPTFTLDATNLACLASGVIAGIGCSLSAAGISSGRGERWRRWSLTILVASLASVLGCFGLETAGLLAVLAALVGGAVLSWIPIAFRAV